MTGSSKYWYEKFLSSFTTPSNILNSSQENLFYSIKFTSIDFRELNHGTYELHVLFYDMIEKQFFGKKFTSTAIVREHSLLIEPQVLFFHTAVTEDRIVIVCEIVKLDRNPWVYAWAAVPLVLRGQALTDYNLHTSGNIQPARYKLYRGSCICLTYVSGLDELDRKVKASDGVISVLIQTNTRLNYIISFIPEHFFISFLDTIPGLTNKSDHFEAADTFTALIDNAVLSYRNSAFTEKEILDLLMQDYCHRLNKRMDNCANGGDAQKFVIIEKRLKVGVHNGLCYVEEPHYLHLYDTDEVNSYGGTFRRRSRSLSRNVGSDSREFVARSCVRLTRLCADYLYAIVFSVDYLVGFCGKDDLIRESQWVMIAWNAWCPFYNNAFTIADTITVPLIGGPRPNPDDVFCFKNLIPTQKQQTLNSGIFVDGSSYCNLKFNFAIVEATNSTILMLPSPRRSDVNRGTPLPDPDLPPLISPESLHKHKHDQEALRLVQDDSGVAPMPPAHVEETKLLAPTNQTISENNKTILHRTQSVPLMENKLTNLTTAEQYTNDFSESRVSAFPRSVSHYFTQFDFQPLIHPDEWQNINPKFVDPSAKRQIAMSDELDAYLSTNEIVLQFLGIHNISNRYVDATPRRICYFFTFQFYRFEEVSTEKLLAHTKSQWKSEMPMVFQRIDENNLPVKLNGNGFAARFTVNKSSIPCNDADDFAQYLIWDKLHIDVWNADTLIHVGTCTLPMHMLCRQGIGAVVSDVQCAIVQDGLADGPVTTGLLYLRMANIGRPSEKRNSFGESGFSRICSQSNSERLLRRKARTLNTVHESALQKFLSTQKLDLYQRKEEIFSNDALRRVQRWKEAKKESHTPINSSMKRFIFREELEAYKTLRSESKASALLRAVFKGITTRYTVHAKYGQVEFFEFLLRNTFAEQVVCAVEVNDPQLSLVLDVDEWRFYKSVFHLKTPIEQDLFSVENREDGPRVVILLSAMESVCVPFKFDPQTAMGLKRFGNSLSTNTEIRAIFKRTDTEEPIGILEVLAQNRNLIVNRSLRYFCEENRKVTRLFRIREIKGNKQILSCRASLPSALCSLRNSATGMQELFISCSADSSPAIKTFVVMLYEDKYFSKQLAVWKFTVHSMRRLDVQAIQGQLTKIPLPLRVCVTKEKKNLLQLFTSSEAVTFQPPKTFTSEPELLDDVQAFFVPNFSGTRIILINVLDIQLSRLLLSWLVSATVCEPNIVKVYDVKLPLHFEKPISKKIALTNAYNISKRFRVHTSNLNTMSVEEEYYNLAPKSSTQIQLNFQPVSLRKNHTSQVFVFVEDADIAQQEEAYSFRISYVNEAIK